MKHMGDIQADQKIELSKWLVNAFNGEWLRTEDVRPKGEIGPGDIED